MYLYLFSFSPPPPLRQALYAAQTDFELPMLVKLAWKAGFSCPCHCLQVLELETCTPVLQALKYTSVALQCCPGFVKSSTFLQLQQQWVISYGALGCLWLFVSTMYVCTSLVPPEYNSQRTHSQWHLITLLYRMYLIC